MVVCGYNSSALEVEARRSAQGRPGLPSEFKASQPETLSQTVGEVAMVRVPQGVLESSWVCRPRLTSSLASATPELWACSLFRQYLGQVSNLKALLETISKQLIQQYPCIPTGKL